jgi:hypothetical protein
MKLINISEPCFAVLFSFRSGIQIDRRGRMESSAKWPTTNRRATSSQAVSRLLEASNQPAISPNNQSVNLNRVTTYDHNTDRLIFALSAKISRAYQQAFCCMQYQDPIGYQDAALF